jgi:hypothetical protein
MKNLVKWFGITALVAIIGFSMAGCFPAPEDGGDDGGDDGGGGGGGGNPSGTVTTTVTGEGTVLSGTANLSAKLAWLDRSAESHNTYIIEVNANENINPYTFNYSGAINVTVILRGVGENRTVRLSKNGTMFTVNENVTFILDNNITLRGHSQNTGVMVEIEKGIFKMNIGSVITGNTGGGIKLGFMSTFEMNGGTISDNTANDGGGVFIYQGTFIMNGGTISGNTAKEGGGGINGSFTMNGGTISGNTAKQGGGVCISDYSGKTFTMNGGTISGNTATVYGGGVYGGVRSSFFIKTGGTITGSDTNGGNAVKDSQGLIARRGHAVYSGDTRRKENTAGPSVNLSSDSDTGWDD